MFTVFALEQSIRGMDLLAVEDLIFQLRALRNCREYVEDQELDDRRRSRLTEALAHRELLAAQLKLC